MADIQFFEDDSGDPLGEDDTGGFGDDVCDYEGTVPEEYLSPLQKLEKYMDSENIYTRQMVARGLLDTLRQVFETECDDLTGVLKAMVQLSEDPESMVRLELMEQVPHIAMYCQENRHVDAFMDVVPVYLLPMIVRYLTDANSQVRKTSQAALLVLLEQELVEKEDVEEQVCPTILELTGPDSIEEHRTEAVALMSKMTPLVGRDITERVFLPRFIVLCSDLLFHVRKVCAANFGDMCSVVGTEATEKHLLPKFYYLCEDGVWGVRKACAECFTAVSCACSQEFRKNQLTSVFVNLICDQSRWVRMAAFQALGPFISTFADPSMTGLYFNEDGVLCVGQVDPHRNRSIFDPPDGIETEQDMNNIDKEKDSENVIQEQIDQEKSIDSEKSSCDNSETAENSEKCSLKDLITQVMEMEIEEENEDRSSESKGQGQETVVGNAGDQAEDKSIEEKLWEKYQTRTANKLTSSEKDSCETEAGKEEASSGQNMEELKEDSLENEGNKSPELLSSANQGNCEITLSPKEPFTATTTTDGHVHIHYESNNINAFSSFNYWRPPLPDIDLDLDLVNGKPTNIHVTAKVKDSTQCKVFSTEVDVSVTKNEELGNQVVVSSEEEQSGNVRIHTASVSTVSDESENVANIGSTHVIGQNINESTLAVVNGVVQDVDSELGLFDDSFGSDDIREQAGLMQEEKFLNQDVIPQALLENYLSMTDPSRAQTVDTEIVRHCAYSLPAVAYTLGREHWPCLKELYETLAQDMQWKVRRTLAFSIHELATILGEEITQKDLVPVFDGFLKDLDEVRIGVLKHLSDFLKLLSPKLRKEYLGKIPEFLTTDNTRNWRFREELGNQLISVCEQYSALEISQNLFSVAMTLAEDRVMEVRNVALKVLAVVLKRLTVNNEDKLVLEYVNDTLEKFALSKKWHGRQTFCQLCHNILQEDAISPDHFSKDFMPSLLHLGSDNIPNVRISLAKCLSQSVLPCDYFTSYKNPHHQDLLKVVKSLQCDTDRDVRYFVSLSPQTDIEHLEIVPV